MTSININTLYSINNERKLPQISIFCTHKIDVFGLSNSGVLLSQSKKILSIFQEENQQGIELKDLGSLTISDIASLANQLFSGKVILYSQLFQLLTLHNERCETYPNEFEDFSNIVQTNAYKSKKEVRLRSNALIEGKSASLRTYSGHTPLDEVGLSTRSYNALKREGVNYLFELMLLEDHELLDFRNFGENSLSEVRNLREIYKNLEPEMAEEQADLTYLTHWITGELSDQLHQIILDAEPFKNIKADSLLNSFSPWPFDEAKGIVDKSLDYFSTILMRVILAETNISNLIELLSITNNLQNVVSEYKRNRMEITPNKSLQDSFLLYEREYSADVLGLLKFDSLTLTASDLSRSESKIFEGNESLFDLLHYINTNLVTDIRLWTSLKRMVEFHAEFGTFLNTNGMILALVINGPSKREEILIKFQEALAPLRPGTFERDLLILQARLSGQTLDKIGSTFNLTRERIRQILRSISPEIGRISDVVRQRTSLSASVALVAKVESIFEEFGAVYLDELLRELNLSEDIALSKVPKKYLKFIMPQEFIRLNDPTWSKNDVIEIIRRAATYYFPLRIADYEHLVDIGEIDGPSVPYIYQKIGQWSDICNMAGVESAPALRLEYVRLWSQDEMLSFFRRFLMEPNYSSSLGSYDEWRESQHDHVPSGVLLRNEFGNWTRVKRLSLESLRREKGKEVRS